MTTQQNPFTEARTVWSVTPTLAERVSARGAHLSVAALSPDTPTPSRSNFTGIHHVTAGKRRAARRPFSRFNAPVFDPALATNNPA